MKLALATLPALLALSTAEPSTGPDPYKAAVRAKVTGACGNVSDAAYDQLEAACDACSDAGEEMMTDIQDTCGPMGAVEQRRCVRSRMLHLMAQLEEPAAKDDMHECISRQLSRMGASDEALQIFECAKTADLKPTLAEMGQMLEDILKYLQNGGEE